MAFLQLQLASPASRQQWACRVLHHLFSFVAWWCAKSKQRQKVWTVIAASTVASSVHPDQGFPPLWPTETLSISERSPTEKTVFHWQTWCLMATSQPICTQSGCDGCCTLQNIPGGNFWWWIRWCSRLESCILTTDSSLLWGELLEAAPQSDAMGGKVLSVTVAGWLEPSSCLHGVQRAVTD